MKSKLILIGALLVFFASQGAFFVVSEGEQALITEFGKPVAEKREAGLGFKIPFIQKVSRFERRILKWDGDPNQIPTADKKFVWVDATARWRIVEPLVFFRTVATERGAQSRLDDIIDSAVRDAVSGNLLVDLVRGSDYQAPEDAREETESQVEESRIGREEILSSILEKARQNTPEYGIELIDVQIKRINYVEQVRRRVYERMTNERKKVAAEYRSEEEGEQADILGQMEKELKQIRSDAQRRSLEIRGQADAEAAGIYAKAYSRDPEFYGFVRTLDAYREVIQKNGRLVLSTDSEIYQYLKNSR